jgi:Mn-containing catalase
VFTHTHALQYEAKPDGPDAAYARRLQEVLGGQWGEMTVATQYLSRPGSEGGSQST